MACRTLSGVQECPNPRGLRCDLARLGRTTGTDRPNGCISDRGLAPRQIIVERIGQLTTYIIGGAVAFFGRFADAQDRSEAAGPNTAQLGPYIGIPLTAEPAPRAMPHQHDRRPRLAQQADRKSTRLNPSHKCADRMPSFA